MLQFAAFDPDAAVGGMRSLIYNCAHILDAAVRILTSLRLYASAEKL